MVTMTMREVKLPVFGRHYPSGSLQESVSFYCSARSASFSSARSIGTRPHPTSS
jgi:hypothetical protein